MGDQLDVRRLSCDTLWNPVVSRHCGFACHRCSRESGNGRQLSRL